MLLTVPFSGFYESIHSSEIDAEVELLCSDDEGVMNESIYYAVSSAIDYRKLHEQYAKDYVASFAEMLELESLKFESLQSPREYNFSTDIIYATLSGEEFVDMFIFAKRRNLDAVCRNNLTSRSGFSSFYDPDFKTWNPNVMLWDHNQASQVLEAKLLTEFPDFDQLKELELMEKACGNGMIYQWLSNKKVDELLSIKDYN